MKFHESKEDYLETILILKNQKDKVRPIDVANYLNYSRPSISRALKLLKDENLITIDNNHNINFTNDGYKLAQSVYERHTTIRQFLEYLGVTSEIAEQDACKIEHIISNDAFDKIKDFLNKK